MAVILNKADLVPQQQCDEAVREVWSPPDHSCHDAASVSGQQLRRVIAGAACTICSREGFLPHLDLMLVR